VENLRLRLLKEVVSRGVIYPVVVGIEEDNSATVIKGLGLVSLALIAAKAGEFEELERNSFWRWWQGFLSVGGEWNEGDPSKILLAWLEDWEEFGTV